MFCFVIRHDVLYTKDIRIMPVVHCVHNKCVCCDHCNFIDSYMKFYTNRLGFAVIRLVELDCVCNCITRVCGWVVTSSANESVRENCREEPPVLYPSNSADMRRTKVL
jgi:hypothetical protein